MRRITINLNYEGSLAQRFMKFNSTLETTVDTSTNIFNALELFVPKSLASANLVNGSYDPAAVTSTSYVVLTVNVDNYKEIMASTGAMFAQWSPAFNDGTNSSLIIYIVIFDDTTFSPTLTATSISWAPLTQAFNELYFNAFFKTMFSEHYDGTSDDTEDEVYDDSNYFDLVLCLDALCEAETNMSFCWNEIHVEVPTSTDANTCKILSQTKAAELAAATTFTSTTKATRAQYFYGYWYLLGGKRSANIVHNGNYMFPIILGAWFTRTNVSGEFVGNKLSRLRLSGTRVKPTGLPSPLNSAVNMNLPKVYYTNLDDKLAGYFISIADGTENNAELLRDRNVDDAPIQAYMIAKYIDYNSSQSLAKYASDMSTVNNPVLANMDTYKYIQSLVYNYIAKFAGFRLSNIKLSFPPYSQAKKGQRFEGTATWSAHYEDDFAGCDISGTVSF